MKALFVSIILFVTTVSWSQQSDSQFYVNNPNLELLDSLIFEAVNDKRLEMNRAKIFKSEELDSLANYHSLVMANRGKVFYSTDRPKAGECNLDYVLTEDPPTYQGVAKAIVEKWVVSPGHAKLILGEFFIYGGSGVAVGQSTVMKDHLFVCFRISYWP